MPTAPTSRFPQPPGGMCADCAFARVIHNRRGSLFLRCGRHDQDPAYAKYPRLPVLECAGYREREAREASDSRTYPLP